MMILGSRILFGGRLCKTKIPSVGRPPAWHSKNTFFALLFALLSGLIGNLASLFRIIISNPTAPRPMAVDHLFAGNIYNY
jgi:hypothetical protein